MANIANMNLPPHSIESEKAVLCSIFIDNNCMYTTEWYGIKASDFYLKEHQYIFEGMHNYYQNRKTIDVVTLSDYLGKRKELEKIWGIQYLYDISMFIPTASGIKAYSKIVKEKAVLRDILSASQKIIWSVYEEKPVEEILEEVEKTIINLTQYQMADSLVHIKDILNGRYETYFELAEDPEKIKELNTNSGYEWLDIAAWWFKPWELIILAARPAMGKTSFALNLAENAAIKYGKKVAVFSLEMGKNQIADRLISTVSKVNMTKISKWDLTDEDFASIGQALEKLWWVDIYIDDKWWATVQEMKSKLRRLKIEKWGIDILIIDYLQLMTWSNRFAWNRVQEISEISRGLKEMARELEIPVLALSQLSRAVESRPDKRPQLSDLRESWAIEQDADMVMMLYREDYYDSDTDRKWLADIFLRKNRNWPTASIELYFEKQIMKFSNLEKKLETE